MPTESDEPLRKVTLNLFAKDVAWLERKYGRGWTEIVRNHIRSKIHLHMLSTYSEDPKDYSYGK